MRLYRGRAATTGADRDATAAMLDRTGTVGEPALRVWTPHRQVAFGRRDVHEPGYDAARAAAEARGYPVVERSVGGRAVAYTGSTLAFAHAVPLDEESDARRGIGARYDDAVATVVAGLRAVGVDARPGEPPNAFCPGTHSVQAADEGGRPTKLAGIAQRVRSDGALVAGIVHVRDHDDLREVLVAVYDALEVPLDPDTVGSVATSGGPADPDPVARVLEGAFVGDRSATTVAVDDLLAGERSGGG